MFPISAAFRRTGLLLALIVASASAATKPNLIVVVTDDQANWTLGCYGGPDAVSPHLDALARDGARFTRAFTATPVCSPSRATHLTGRYGTQLGITDWISPEEGAAGIGLKPGTITWPAVLQRAGWATGLFGKWHLGMQPQFHPTRFGFDHFFGFVGNGAVPRNPKIDFPDGQRSVPGWFPDLLVDDALRFLDARRGQPFALSLHFREPHEPYGPMPAADEAVFAGRKLTLPDLPGLDRAYVEKRTRAYLAATHAIDRNLGRVFDYLRQHGLWENTVVVFTSDHGYHLGHQLVEGKGNAAWIAGGIKGPRRPNLWDLSLRVPLLIRWPGVTRPGSVIPQQVSNIDFFATFLAIAGVPVPAGVAHEGIDFTPLLRGATQPARATVFAQYDLHNTSYARLRSARTERWKLVRRFDGQRLDELYDLAADPEERKNLIVPGAITVSTLKGEPARARADLDAQLLAWMRAIDDPVLPAAGAARR